MVFLIRPSFREHFIAVVGLLVDSFLHHLSVHLFRASQGRWPDVDVPPPPVLEFSSKNPKPGFNSTAKLGRTEPGRNVRRYRPARHDRLINPAGSCNGGMRPAHEERWETDGERRRHRVDERVCRCQSSPRLRDGWRWSRVDASHPAWQVKGVLMKGGGGRRTERHGTPSSWRPVLLILSSPPQRHIRDWLITDGAPLASLGATVMVIMSYGAARQRAPRFR